jgi:hypothetical protein
MIGYGWGSETLRVSVNNDGLVNLNWLKIKSNGSSKGEMLAELKSKPKFFKKNMVCVQ